MSKEFTSLIKSSDHPDPCVREAENFGSALKDGIIRLSRDEVSVEQLGFSWQKFFVDRLRFLFKDRDETIDSLRAQLAESEAARENLEINLKACRDRMREIVTAKVYSDEKSAQFRATLVYLLGQPFNGSWDAQAVYLQGVLKNNPPSALREVLQFIEQKLEQISDPRKRDHKEPDAYTEMGCVMNMASEALDKLRQWRSGE